MARAGLTEVRLTQFKSFENAALPIDATTVIIGRNGAGKSNALDALEVLARLASGDDIRDALDSRSSRRGAIRGGSAGCAPHGTNEFELGCRVVLGTDEFDYDVRIQVDPDVKVVAERLRGPAPALESRRIDRRELVAAEVLSDQSTSIWTEVHNGKRGSNPGAPYRDNRLVITQVPLRLDPRDAASRAVIRACSAVTAAMSGVFHLDPVPHLMREYAQERDDELQRTGANLSATVASLRKSDPEASTKLVSLLSQVSDLDLEDVGVVRSDLGDVMMTIEERVGGRVESTPAREMSDGLLRFAAMCTALLTSSRGLDLSEPREIDGAEPNVTLVVEEVENGLHPSQASGAIDFIRETSARTGARVLVTTHSPALLNSVRGELSQSVIVCYRDRATGRSRLTRVTELPGYARAMGAGGLGDVVTHGKLSGPEVEPTDYSANLETLGLR